MVIKRSHILKQSICDQVYLSICDLFITTRYQRVKVISRNSSDAIFDVMVVESQGKRKQKPKLKDQKPPA